MATDNSHNENEDKDKDEEIVSMQITVIETVKKVYQVHYKKDDLPKSGQLGRFCKRAYRKGLLGKPIKEKESLDVGIRRLFSTSEIKKIIRADKARGKDRYESFTSIYNIVGKSIAADINLVELMVEEWPKEESDDIK